jgi:endonuclease III
MATVKPDRPITRDDLQRTFQALQDDIQGKVESKRSTLVTVGGVVAVVALLTMFFLGKRAGRKRTTLVEIRRV